MNKKRRKKIKSRKKTKRKKIKSRKKIKRKKIKKSQKLENGELIFKVPKKWAKQAYVDRNQYVKKYKYSNPKTNQERRTI